MVTSSLPIAWTIVAFARSREIDVVDPALAGITLSLLAVIGDDARFPQWREQLAVAVTGCLVRASAASDKPPMYQLARARIKDTHST
jgi:hypothetical protein